MREFDYINDYFAFAEPMQKEEAFSLLIYDIIDDKSRIKFAKFMESYGIRVQKSAFEIRINKKKLKEMIDLIPKYITKEDSVKLYRIKSNCDVTCWGNARKVIAEEILII